MKTILDSTIRFVVVLLIVTTSVSIGDTEDHNSQEIIKKLSLRSDGYVTVLLDTMIVSCELLPNKHSIIIVNDDIIEDTESILDISPKTSGEIFDIVTFKNSLTNPPNRITTNSYTPQPRLPTTTQTPNQSGRDNSYDPYQRYTPQRITTETPMQYYPTQSSRDYSYQRYTTKHSYLTESFSIGLVDTMIKNFANPSNKSMLSAVLDHYKKYD